MPARMVHFPQGCHETDGKRTYGHDGSTLFPPNVDWRIFKNARVKQKLTDPFQ